MYGKLLMETITRITVRLGKLCAYCYIYKLLLAFINGKKLSELTKSGRNIALLGLFCPFFWFSLFSGADSSTLLLNGLHSGIVFLIGIVIMFVGFQKNDKNE